MCCCLAEDLALCSACCPIGNQWRRNPHNTASCRFRPRKTCDHCQLGMPVSGKEREGRRGREGSLQDERTLLSEGLQDEGLQAAC